ncbi:MAG: type II toxin-antitoxin system prevent-host-death family antitoxin [Actinobacteria bacterium]|nr:type II toxin-antitoxin system prevent-host-death family antitoxin [Actinomycetota bacterium]
MSAAEQPIEQLSQREFRNESGRVLRSVAEGHSFILTNHGVPVARVEPISTPAPPLAISRPASRTGGWRALNIKRVAAGDLSGALDELRDERL